MRFYRFRTKKQTRQEYLTEAAAWTDDLLSGRTGLTPEEAEQERREVFDMVTGLTYREVEELAKHEVLIYGRRDLLMDIIDQSFLLLCENFRKYNNPRYGTDPDRHYSFTTFAFPYVRNAFRTVAAQDMGISTYVWDRMSQIRKAKKAILEEQDNRQENVPPVLLQKEIERQKGTTIPLDFVSNLSCLQELRGSEGYETDRGEEDPELERMISRDALYETIGRYLNTLPQVCQVAALFGADRADLYSGMTRKELSVDRRFLAYVRADQRFAEAVRHGDVEVQHSKKTRNGYHEPHQYRGVDYMDPDCLRHMIDYYGSRLIRVIRENFTAKDCAGCLAEVLSYFWRERMGE